MSDTEGTGDGRLDDLRRRIEAEEQRLAESGASAEQRERARVQLESLRAELARRESED